MNLEIVLVPLDVTYYDFKKHFGGTQWFSVPYKGKCREKLACYFNIPPETVQMVFGPGGKIVNSNGVSVIENYGYNNVFPFTSERYAELVGMVRARMHLKLFFFFPNIKSIICSNMLIWQSAFSWMTDSFQMKRILFPFS